VFVVFCGGTIPTADADRTRDRGAMQALFHFFI
jgi:hypothetical protein